jgi:hypothetical protein
MRYLFLIVLLNLTQCIFSQNTITTKVIVFDEEDIDQYDSSPKFLAKNAIKFNPLLLFNGEIPIYYERAITNNLSGELGLGITFKDYIGDLWRSIDEDTEWSNSKSKSHFSYKLGLRYYTGGEALDGFYFALEHANRKFSQDILIESNNYNPTSGEYENINYNLEEKQFHKEYKIICGNQEHDYFDHFFLDYYLGVGINKRTSTKIESNDNGTYSTKEVEETLPRFYLGVKLGFEF